MSTRKFKKSVREFIFCSITSSKTYTPTSFEDAE